MKYVRSNIKNRLGDKIQATRFSASMSKTPLW